METGFHVDRPGHAKGIGSWTIVRRRNLAVRGGFLLCYPRKGSNAAYRHGRYEVDAARRVVTHLRENHTNPAQATVEAVRGFEFNRDLLILTVEPARQLRVIWRKRR